MLNRLMDRSSIKFAVLAALLSATAVSSCAKHQGDARSDAALRAWDRRLQEAVLAVREAPPWPAREGTPIPPMAPGGEATPAEVATMEAGALSGDAEAAWALSWFYRRRAPIDRALVEKWERIAAENGHPGAANGVANRLAERGGLENCRRARFWYDRAGSAEIRRGEGSEITALLNALGLATGWEECVKRDPSRPREIIFLRPGESEPTSKDAG